MSMYGDEKSLLFALRARDRLTMIHCLNVAHYVSIIAQACGFNGEEVKRFSEGGILHDIGKIGISDRLLKSTDKYTKQDWEEIKQHVYIGGVLLKSLGFPAEVVQGAMYHHERFDGKGYPCGLAGAEIPLLARMICVADTFDALTSYRPYRQPVGMVRALEIMLGSRGQFDPEILEIFIDTITADDSRQPAAENSSIALPVETPKY